MKLTYLAPAACAFLLSAAPGLATTTFAPGTIVDTLNYEDNEVGAGDPVFFDTLLETVVVSVNETRNGFIGGDVIVDLYDVTVELTTRVWRGSAGNLVFGYDFEVTDNSGAGDFHGSTDYAINGFGGFDLSFGYLLNSAGPYAPRIERSADGESIAVNYFDPRDPSSGIETLLFVTDASDYRLNGTGVLDVSIESFGVTPRAVGGLPVPATVPLPAGLALMLMALGTLGWMRRA